MQIKHVLTPAARTLAIIMGGGAGTRLFPLTKDRAKPAVPIGGKYRLVDIPISNCLNSGIRGIYVLTQFNSTSLHRHINASYKFDNFSPSFVEILAAQQTPEGSSWYQGTSDAVRQNLRTFTEGDYDYFIILSGDQLYRMDYRDVLQQHIAAGAELTISCIPVNREGAAGFGIMETDAARKITRFVEKPKNPAALEELRMKPELLRDLSEPDHQELYLASMGIYVFSRQVLIDCLDNDLPDFGKDIIPATIGSRNVQAYIFRGYWEDIGTIRSFFDANLNLCDPNPQYSFYAPGAPIYTQSRFLPASVIEETVINRAMISDGCQIRSSRLERCVVGIRSLINPGSRLRNTIVMGADFYESDTGGTPAGMIPIGIGRDCLIEDAIIDKNARIGDGVVITPHDKDANSEGPSYYIRDGIVVIPKNAVIPSGTKI
ncbi:MAG: glucose-1-phosphate adenylyltransferase [Verrucomicrobia bacterium]|jgi:glucose-1-phosphate adenylyltransferase|nr:glucose-1-phosphate adenylyltransferase [Verrucomicrobiota bacterium]